MSGGRRHQGIRRYVVEWPASELVDAGCVDLCMLTNLARAGSLAIASVPLRHYQDIGAGPVSVGVWFRMSETIGEILPEAARRFGNKIR